jgi:hypothetical protein
MRGGAVRRCSRDVLLRAAVASVPSSGKYRRGETSQCGRNNSELGGGALTALITARTALRLSGIPRRPTAACGAACALDESDSEAPRRAHRPQACVCRYWLQLRPLPIATASSWAKIYLRQESVCLPCNEHSPRRPSESARICLFRVSPASSISELTARGNRSTPWTSLPILAGQRYESRRNNRDDAFGARQPTPLWQGKAIERNPSIHPQQTKVTARTRQDAANGAPYTAL